MNKLFLITSALLLLSCSSSKESKKTNDAEEFTAELRRYEATFQPSGYNPDVKEFFTKEKERPSTEQDTAPEERVAEALELVPGFRVQIFSSQEIDEANATLAELQGLFPEEWFYLVYDAPAYKIRAGNCLTRYEADKFVNQLSARGYRDAWVVPEKVIKNPPPRPQGEPTEKK